MVRLLLRFHEKVMDQPIIAQVILEQRVPINILSAHFNQQESRILVEIPASNAEKVAESFRGKGVEVFSRELVRVDNELCFECGACVSLCPVNAIIFKEDYSVVFERGKCIGKSCGLCIDACPARAIEMVN